MLFIYKILHDDVNSKLNSLFTNQVFAGFEVYSFALQVHAFKLNLPKPRTDTLKYDFVYRVVKA